MSLTMPAIGGVPFAPENTFQGPSQVLEKKRLTIKRPIHEASCSVGCADQPKDEKKVTMKVLPSDHTMGRGAEKERVRKISRKEFYDLAVAYEKEGRLGSGRPVFRVVDRPTDSGSIMRPTAYPAACHAEINESL